MTDLAVSTTNGGGVSNLNNNAGGTISGVITMAGAGASTFTNAGGATWNTLGTSTFTSASNSGTVNIGPTAALGNVATFNTTTQFANNGVLNLATSGTA